MNNAFDSISDDQIKALEELTLRWELSDEELANILDAPIQSAVNQAELPRIAASPHLRTLLDIDRSLALLFRNPVNRDGWIRRRNADFNGECPLALITSGLEGLERVHRYLTHAAVNG